MIYDDIKNFNKQFEYKPKVENVAVLTKLRKNTSGIIVAGMGGSHLGRDVLKSLKPELDLMVWSNYGLPPMHQGDLKKRLVIASSYSGNTEETVDAFLEARKRGVPVAAVAAGGKLISLAKKYKVPYIEMPDLHMQPRMALGLNLRSLLKIMGENSLLRETDKLKTLLYPARLENAGKKLARRLKGKIPVIYASLRNSGLVYNWKIKFNETGKIPAFWDFFPELNHNEMTGFDVKPRTRSFTNKFHFIFLKDSEDDPRILKRMNVLEKLYRERGLSVEVSHLRGQNRLHKFFSSLILADWTSFYIAKMYNIDPENVPIVEDFKKRIA